jgi:diguanylate cyclase (GGDEF)-like protein
MNLQEAINLTKSSVEAAGAACPVTVRDALDDLYKAALQDDKTRLGNAQSLNLAASKFGTGGDNPDVVVFGDLNHFHNFNKQHGHVIGDAAIFRVGALIKSNFVDDCQAEAFRTGGDEFVILLSSSALERFKGNVPSFERCAVPAEGNIRETSMSFGYAISQGEIGFGELRSRAEAACRVAKLRGNGVCVEWTDASEEIDSIRGRCTACEGDVTCYLPRRASLECKNLCPCCGNTLSQ